MAASASLPTFVPEFYLKNVSHTRLTIPLTPGCRGSGRDRRPQPVCRARRDPHTGRVHTELARANFYQALHLGVGQQTTMVFPEAELEGDTFLARLIRAGKLVKIKTAESEALERGRATAEMAATVQISQAVASSTLPGGGAHVD